MIGIISIGLPLAEGVVAKPMQTARGDWYVNLHDRRYQGLLIGTRSRETAERLAAALLDAAAAPVAEAAE